MRRRRRGLNRADQLPARLREFGSVDWLPQVDPSEYHADDWRNIRNGEPYGPPLMSFENWRRNEAWNLFSRARSNWQLEHGWPGGLDYIELLQETVQIRRNSICSDLHGRSDGR